MSLSAKDKATVKKFWEKAEAKSSEIGAEALGRTLVVFPQTKTYFSHWGSDLNAQTPQVKKHGGVILEALGKIIKKIDNLPCALGPLSELHAYKLRVDPANFKFLSHNIILVLAAYFPTDFTPEVHVAIDKFLQNVALGLSERYR